MIRKGGWDAWSSCGYIKKLKSNVSATENSVCPSFTSGSLYPLVSIFCFLWVVTLTHQSGFVKKIISSFLSLLAPITCFQLTKSFPAQPFSFYLFTLQGFHYHTVITAGKTCYLKWITHFFPPCPNYMFLVLASTLLIISLSHEDMWCLHVPRVFSLEGDLLIMKGQVLSESPRGRPLWVEIWCEELFYYNSET